MSARVGVAVAGAGMAGPFALFGSEGSVTFESSHPDELRLYTRGLDEPERNGPGGSS